MKWVQRPNLPEARVCEVIMSDYRPAFKSELEKAGIRVRVPKRLPMIDGAEAYHADMSNCYLGNGRLWTADMLDSPVTAKMPLLNICIVGRYVICHTKKAYRPILAVLQSEGMTILHTNQGYAKCACAVVGENAIITADPSIIRLCRAEGIDVLPVSQGDIALDGYPYGFIGGCCGMLDPHTLAFSGNIALHRDYHNIRSFARNYGISLYSLTNTPLYDIGGILPIRNAENSSTLFGKDGQHAGKYLQYPHQ